MMNHTNNIHQLDPEDDLHVELEDIWLSYEFLLT